MLTFNPVKYLIDDEKKLSFLIVMMCVIFRRHLQRQ